MFNCNYHITSSNFTLRYPCCKVYDPLRHGFSRNSNSATSCEDPFQLETNSASISSSKKLTTFWRNGASVIEHTFSENKDKYKADYYFESKPSFTLF